MKSYFNDVNYFYLLLSLFFMKVSHASRAYRWKYSLLYLGYQSSFLNNFMAISVGYLLNLTIPRSGELSRAAVLQKYDSIPFDKGFGTIIAERIIDLVFLIKVSHASRAYRWKYSLLYLGYQSSFLNNFMAISVGYLLNLTIPRSGELSRAAVLQKYDSIPFDKGFGTIIAERIIDLVFLI